MSPLSPGGAPQRRWPLEYRWPAGALPLKAVAQPAREPAGDPGVPETWQTGPAGWPFDFAHAMRRACADIVSKCSALHHVDVDRLLIAAAPSRRAVGWGLQARLTPLRCEGGALRRRKRGCTYQVQRYFVGHREMLYLVTFSLPRFLNRPFGAKLVTVIHELYHIGPAFDGDLRRHPGRYRIHADSRARYDARMAELAREYLRVGPEPGALDFLRMDYSQLMHRHGAVLAPAVPKPKLIPLAPRSGT